MFETSANGEPDSEKSVRQRVYDDAPSRPPIATDDDDRNNRPSTPPPTKYKPAHLRGTDTDHRTRRSPTRQQHARRADYRQNSDNEHSARSDRSNNRYEHANRSARSHDINDQCDSRSDRNARDDSDDARDDHHDLGSDRRFDGYDATRATHNVHDRRSCDNSDDYVPRFFPRHASVFCASVRAFANVH